MSELTPRAGREGWREPRARQNRSWARWETAAGQARQLPTLLDIMAGQEGKIEGLVVVNPGSVSPDNEDAALLNEEKHSTGGSVLASLVEHRVP